MRFEQRRPHHALAAGRDVHLLQVDRDQLDEDRKVPRRVVRGLRSTLYGDGLARAAQDALTRCAITESVFASMDFTDAVFEECRFAGTRFDGCDLRNARFPRSSDLFVDPAKNKVKGARVPLDTAILLATSFGMRVLGFDESKDE
ncbi:pentapeptide repeat-containing protein [Polyangium fumosum]|uniref:Pentapeptide repeat-containing protein n=1 Tax=Polyangium fumosum TaxID=889272 RepID=A0A4U1IJT2_9BACT|nr:pentapeptide repeat-containing protein [Polyangium fumosum]TKC94185.1 hypothetical protein E8A74_48485 [Polyangium fumosum]